MPNVMIGFCIGNGESRKGLNLASLSEKGLTVGCNALYRDFEPDVLVSVDKAMFDEINQNYFGFWLYRNPDRKFYLGHKILKDRMLTSGATSMYIAIEYGCNKLYMIGHDLNAIVEKKTRNNVYNDTKNYKPSTSSCLDYEKFREDVESVIINYPNVEFVFVNHKQETIYNYKNVRYINYNTFNREMFNEEK